MFKQDKTFTSDFLGEHMNKYNDEYGSIKGDCKNVNQIRHILSQHKNSTTNFELGLRGNPNTVGGKENQNKWQLIGSIPVRYFKDKENEDKEREKEWMKIQNNHRSCSRLKENILKKVN
jgi:hypothetical protein